MTPKEKYVILIRSGYLSKDAAIYCRCGDRRINQLIKIKSKLIDRQ